MPGMRTLTLVVALSLLCSCSTIESIQRSVEKIETTISEVRAEADVNKDGKVSGFEWVQWALAALGLGGVGGAGALVRRNAKSNERKAVLETRVAALEKGSA